MQLELHRDEKIRAISAQSKIQRTVRPARPRLSGKRSCTTGGRGEGRNTLWYKMSPL